MTNLSQKNITDYNFIQALQSLQYVEKIILFGSRARGDNAARADLDLAILCPTASASEWLHILNIVEQADTLLKIDSVRLDELPENSLLKQNIQQEGITIYAKAAG